MSFYRTNIIHRRISILILLQILSFSALFAGNEVSLYSCDTLPANTYTGYRLNIVHVTILKKNSKKALFRFRLINTGKEYIALGDPTQSTLPIQIYFDTAFYRSADYVLENDFRTALLKKKISLQAGQIMPEMELSVPLSRPINTASKENTSTSTSSASDQPVKSIKSDKNAEFFLPPFNEHECADLRIDTARVIERSKKWILIEFSISNQGNAAAIIAGPEKGDEDNIAVKAYFSGTNKLTKGSVAAGGAFVKDNSRDRIYLLKPGETYAASFQMDISQKSKYTSNIVLYVDNYQLIRECNETNNTFSFFYY